MTFRFTLHTTIPASPREVYNAWLSPSGHRGITGGQKARISDKKGARFTVWDGYITGRNVTLVPGKRIVQSWRTTQFRKADPDSQIEVLLRRMPSGSTRLTLRHTHVPDGHTSYRDGGWQENYFKPMKEFFAAKKKKK